MSSSPATFGGCYHVGLQLHFLTIMSGASVTTAVELHIYLCFAFSMTPYATLGVSSIEVVVASWTRVFVISIVAS